MKAIIRWLTGRPEPPARHLSTVEQRAEELISRLRLPLVLLSLYLSPRAEVAVPLYQDLEALAREALPTLIRLKRWLLD